MSLPDAVDFLPCEVDPGPGGPNRSRRAVGGHRRGVRPHLGRRERPRRISRPEPKPTRRLTVSRLYRDRHHPWELHEPRPPAPVPFIRMRGRWLAEAGFGVGDRLAVEVAEGELVVRRLAAPGE